MIAQSRERSGGTWDGEDYVEHSGHHRAFDDWFLERLPPEPDDLVIDVGCGSGEFTARLASLVPEGSVVGVDQDPSMIEQAQRHVGGNLRFVQAPAHRVDEVVDHGSADMVVSRAMLHWLPPSQYRPVFEGVLRLLRPGGWFHSESAGAGNVSGVVELLHDVAAEFELEPPPPFPHAGVVFEQVEAAGFALAETITDAIVDGVERLRRHDGTYDRTFVRLEILARRPNGS